MISNLSYDSDKNRYTIRNLKKLWIYILKNINFEDFYTWHYTINCKMLAKNDTTFQKKSSFGKNIQINRQILKIHTLKFFWHLYNKWFFIFLALEEQNKKNFLQFAKTYTYIFCIPSFIFCFLNIFYFSQSPNFGCCFSLEQFNLS